MDSVWKGWECENCLHEMAINHISRTQHPLPFPRNVHNWIS